MKNFELLFHTSLTTTTTPRARKMAAEASGGGDDHLLVEAIQTLVTEDMKAEAIVNGVRMFAEQTRADADTALFGLELMKRVFDSPNGLPFLTEYYRAIPRTAPYYRMLAERADASFRKAQAKLSMQAVLSSHRPLVQRFMSTQRHLHLGRHLEAPLLSKGEFIWNANLDAKGAQSTDQFINGWGVSALNQWMWADVGFSDFTLKEVKHFLGQPLGVVTSVKPIPSTPVYTDIRVGMRRTCLMHNDWEYHSGNPAITVDNAKGSRINAWYVVRKVLVPDGQLRSVVQRPPIPPPAQQSQAATAAVAAEDASITTDAAPAVVGASAGAAAVAASNATTSIGAAAAAAAAKSPAAAAMYPTPESTAASARAAVKAAIRMASGGSSGVDGGGPAGANAAGGAGVGGAESAGARAAAAVATAHVDNGNLAQKRQFGVDVFREIRGQYLNRPRPDTVAVWRIIPYLTNDGAPPNVPGEHLLYHVARVLRVNDPTAERPKESVFNAALYPRRLKWYPKLAHMRTIEVYLAIDSDRTQFSTLSVI